MRSRSNRPGRGESTLVVTPNSDILGASVEGLDLAAPLSRTEFDAVLRALARHAVIRFPQQKLSSRQLADFSARFGELEINVANVFQEPDLPQVMILSNIVEHGKPIGMADAGHGFLFDMSYSRVILLSNPTQHLHHPE